MLVEGNKIKAISAGEIEAGSQATVIDGGGRTLMPGLIDMHVHTSTFGPVQTLSRDMLHPYAHGALGAVTASAADQWIKTTVDYTYASRYMTHGFNVGDTPAHQPSIGLSSDKLPGFSFNSRSRSFSDVPAQP